MPDLTKEQLTISTAFDMSCHIFSLDIPAAISRIPTYWRQYAHSQPLWQVE